MRSITTGCPPFAARSASCALLVWMLWAATAVAQTAWYEGFEGSERSWTAAGGDGVYRIELHKRVQGEARTGQGCERLRVAAASGTYVYLAHSAGRARVIDELAISVQLKCDRGGPQLLARVVLPRSVDPQTGQPMTVLVRGGAYEAVGRWQAMRLDGIPLRLGRQLRVLQSQATAQLDPREAYIDAVLLNVYGGPGVTNIWIDDLDIAGHVQAEAQSVPAVAADVPSWSHQNTSLAAPPTPVISARGRSVLSRSVLLVDGKPAFIRAIEHQGEPLAELRRLGFNAVWMAGMPTADLLAEARRQGIGLIAPPPRPQAPLLPGDPVPALAPIAPGYDAVVAWDMGSGLTEEHLEAIREWSAQVKAADHRQGRPLICRAESDLRSYSRCVDLLLTGRSPLGSSLELTDYGTWLRQRPRLPLPGTPMWTAIQTQAVDPVVEQWQTLGAVAGEPQGLSSEQIRLLVYTAVTAGARGLRFESRSPLSADDVPSRRRAAILELLNAELGLIEPWLAAGSYVTTVPSSEPGVVAAVLEADRAKLVVPIWTAPGAQFVPGQSAGTSISFVVPGVPESSDAYLLTPGQLQPIRRKRVAGGRRITIDEFGLTTLVVLTQDPLVVSDLSQRSAQVARRASELSRNLAVDKLEQVESVLQRLGQTAPASAAGVSSPQVSRAFVTARQSIQTSDGFLAARNWSAAYLHAERAMRPLRMLEREYWLAAVRPLTSPVAAPTAVGFDTLAGHWAIMERLRNSGYGPNRLPAGEFEDLNTMMQAGWAHFQHPSAGIEAGADLAPVAVRSGHLGLRLSARAAEAETRIDLVETPPVWMTSPPVPVEAGTLVAVHGWVQIPTAITGSVDGLMIVDSITGEALAERIGETMGWQEFTLFRAAPRSGSMTVSFVLSGLGEVWLDDVTVHTVERAVVETASRR